MLLDIKTLALVLIIMSFISAFVSFFFYQIIKKMEGLKFAAIGASFQALASCFFIIRDPNDPSIPILLTNLGFFLTFAFYYQAVRLFFEQTTAWKSPLSLIAILMPLIYVYRDNAYINERIFVSLAGIGILMLMISYVMFKSPIKLTGRTTLILTYLSSVGVSVFTMIYVVVSPEEITEAANFKILQLSFIWIILTGFISTLTFIILTSEKLKSQTKEQVELLARARDIATKSLQQQRHFLSMLSHEFKAPISAIQANVDAIEYFRTHNVNEVDSSLKRITNVSTRLSTLVDHCLNNEWLAHSIEQHQARLEPLSLTLTVASICDEFSVQFNSNIEEAVIKGEPMFLPVLFSNLVSNACKHAHDISTVEVELLEDGQHYSVRISDDGPGIPESQQEHIFERYYQTEIGEAEGGSGLGLYFVKRITEMHGGTVTVNCEQNTVFTVTLAKLNHTNI